MTSDDVVRLLKEAYIDELETVQNYLANAILLETIRGEVVAESLKEDIQEELGHAEELGYRLRYHDERPPASMDLEASQESLQSPADTADVEAVIDGVIEAEADAIETYEELIDAAAEAGDHVTEDLAVQLLADEQAHEAEFLSFKREYE
ncbi:MAG: ferritin-like domain-containing protein [archaeon]